MSSIKLITTTSAEPAMPTKNSHSSTGANTFINRSMHTDSRLEDRQPQSAARKFSRRWGTEHDSSWERAGAGAVLLTIILLASWPNRKDFSLAAPLACWRLLIEEGS